MANPLRFPPCRRLRLVGLLCALAAVTALAPSFAMADDSDGSRLGARAHKLGTTQRDSLDPSPDASDWRYFELSEETTVEVRLELESQGESVELKLTEAAGETVEKSEVSDGVATIRRELAPGIYYFEVRSSSAVSYAVSLERGGD